MDRESPGRAGSDNDVGSSKACRFDRSGWVVARHKLVTEWQAHNALVSELLDPRGFRRVRRIPILDAVVRGTPPTSANLGGLCSSFAVFDRLGVYD